MKPLMKKKKTYFFIHIRWSNNYLKWRGAATWWTEINCHQTWVRSKWTGLILQCLNTVGWVTSCQNISHRQSPKILRWKIFTD